MIMVGNTNTEKRGRKKRGKDRQRREGGGKKKEVSKAQEQRKNIRLQGGAPKGPARGK